MTSTKPLTEEEVQAAADRFFPLYKIVADGMPKGSTTEDTIKVMESVCGLAQKLRHDKKLEEFGFLKNE